MQICAPAQSHLGSIQCHLYMQVQYWLEVLLSNGIIVDSQVDLELTQMLLPKACPAPAIVEMVNAHEAETTYVLYTCLSSTIVTRRLCSSALMLQKQKDP